MHWQLSGAVSKPDGDVAAACPMRVKGATLPSEPPLELAGVHWLQNTQQMCFSQHFCSRARALALTPNDPSPIILNWVYQAPFAVCQRGRKGESLSQVVVREGETFDSLLRRFNKRVQMDGVLSEARRRAHFEKPSVKRKRKAAAKRRKSSRSSSDGRRT